MTDGSPPPAAGRPETARSGVEGLDLILRGGFTPDRLYLIEGVPGSGKTTLALQFLLEGRRQGERTLYVTLSETEEELREIAASHGWSLDGIAFRELMAREASLVGEDHYTVFHPSEVELTETTKAILTDVERVGPARIVLDSLSELRLLAANALRYRRQVLALKHYLTGRHCTVLVLDDLTAGDRDIQLQSIAHGVIRLEQQHPGYGSERRRLIVVKHRGVAFHGGYHDFVIRRGGIDVFPRFGAADHPLVLNPERLASGIEELDLLLGGGIERGTSTLFVGAPGAGKSSLATQFVWAAAQRGERAAMFIFDESVNTLLTRSAGLGLDLRPHVESGLVSIQHVDPADLSPGQFAHSIRRAVEECGIAVAMIDSLNGYLSAMPEERFLTIQLHELLSYLGQAGVATMLVGAHQGLIGGAMSAPVDASYLADAVVLLRFFEARGEVRQAVSIIKKRGGEHERTIREFRMQDGRISVGEPLRAFRGVLTGVPTIEEDAGRAEERTRLE
jgi:circadian clock protein KaiC